MQNSSQSVTASPVSSRTSRTKAASNASSGPTAPPGSPQRPQSLRRSISSAPALSIKASTPTLIGRFGDGASGSLKKNLAAAIDVRRLPLGLLAQSLPSVARVPANEQEPR